MNRITNHFKFIPFWGDILKSRNISALHITGDKASENCVIIQPYMDFEQTFHNIKEMEHSIEKRKLLIDLKQVTHMFATYQDRVKAIELVENERGNVVKQLKPLTVKARENVHLINELKEKGRQLKADLKSLKINFYPIEDEFIQSFLHLPNTLHKQCPEGDHEKVLFRSQQEQLETNKSHLDYENLIHFIEKSRYYLLNEAADFDIRCPQILTRYFLDEGGFIQTSNPDFTRCVLLEANATPINHYYKVMEINLQNQLNAAYLTGGGSFESFLGSVTKLLVYPNVLPLKFVTCGRLYERTIAKNNSSLFSAIQNNAVTTFVATANPAEAEEQMENILNLCLNFYKIFNIHFRIVYVNASQLMPAECLRAQIEIYSPHEKRYVCVGRVSNYKDFVSKRMLFAMRDQKRYHFLHLVGGPVLYTSRLIAALIEHGEALDYKKVLDNLNSSEKAQRNVLNEFKSLFE